MNNLVLIGFKAAGKTTLGRRVAAKLQKHFIDTDDLFEEPPPILYQKLGEVAFRAREQELLQMLKNLSGCVIATGGGSALNPENRVLLRSLGTIIHLHTPKEIIEQRIGPTHPFLPDYDNRLGIYTTIAHHSA
ncbi:MAG: shikimate kinase, partial [Rhabdochlamydiaceae bacterium]